MPGRVETKASRISQIKKSPFSPSWYNSFSVSSSVSPIASSTDSTTSLPTLPHELHSHIITFISEPFGLLPLCRVSKAFYGEAIQLLYSDVVLTKGNDNIQAWVSQVLTRPDLAKHVVSLTVDVLRVGLPADREVERPQWFSQFSKALCCLYNLQECVFIGLSHILSVAHQCQVKSLSKRWL